MPRELGEGVAEEEERRRVMDMKAAMKILDPIMPLYERDSSDAEVAGLALCVLLRNGYWDLAFESRDDGSLVLIAGNIELRDPARDCAQWRAATIDPAAGEGGGVGREGRRVMLFILMLMVVAVSSQVLVLHLAVDALARKLGAKGGE